MGFNKNGKPILFCQELMPFFESMCCREEREWQQEWRQVGRRMWFSWGRITCRKKSNRTVVWIIRNERRRIKAGSDKAYLWCSRVQCDNMSNKLNQRVERINEKQQRRMLFFFHSFLFLSTIRVRTHETERENRITQTNQHLFLLLKDTDHSENCMPEDGDQQQPLNFPTESHVMLQWRRRKWRNSRVVSILTLVST